MECCSRNCTPAISTRSRNSSSCGQRAWTRTAAPSRQVLVRARHLRYRLSGSRRSHPQTAERDTRPAMKRLRVLRRWFARKFGYARLICLALLIGLAVLRVADPAPVQELRIRTFDTFQVLDPRVKKQRPVTIVDIDEKSLADPSLGQWPWPRTRIADIIANLTRLGAVVIAFDAVFAEPARLNPDNAADTFRDLD